MCISCDGTGKMESSLMDNDFSLNMLGILTEKDECKVCEGSGKLKDKYYKWYVEMLQHIETSLHYER